MTEIPAEPFRVPLDGYNMHLGPSELETVALGLGEFDASPDGNLLTLAEALRLLPTSDRAPTWELAVRHFGRRKPIGQAAGEIGMDVTHAYALLDRFEQELAGLPAGER